MSNRPPMDQACARWFTVCRTVLIASVTCTALPHFASAETATPAEMETVCRNWLAYTVQRQGNWAGASQPTIRDVQDVTIDGVVLGRCYSIFPSGHVVVPVLKELPPIKVSSQNCGLDIGADEGPGRLLREILQHRARLFIDAYGSLEASQAAQEQPLFGRTHRELWDRFLGDPSRFRARINEWETSTRTEVGPLLTSRWHQSAPYNNYCPMGDGGPCVVGCVATAAAQLMRYHQWPPRGIGDWSYYWYGDYSCGGSTDGDWLWADFRDPYNWTDMQDDCLYGCDEEQQHAVAELCYEVGVAFEMFYGHCGSGTLLEKTVDVLPTFFRYGNVIDEEIRGAHSQESWFTIIQEEINNGRPLIYGFLYGASTGHAIVCDGWRDTAGEKQYHMNYGWGGGYDAWYAIDEIYHDFNPDQDVLYRRIMPATGFIFEVRPDGTGDYPTIQAAIDDVLDEDIVELADGVYTGDGNRDIDFHGRPVTVRSESGDPKSCVIDCQGNPEEHRGFRFLSAEGPLSILEGITIRNGFAGCGGAISCVFNSSPTIRNCLIRGNEAQSGGGGLHCSGASPSIDGCIFSFNTAAQNGGAVMTDYSAGPTFTGCTFFANAAAENGGSALWISGDSDVDIDNSIVAFGTGGGAVRCEGSATATLECCDVYGNADGDWDGCIADQFGIDGNISADPLFCDRENENLRLQEESPCGPEQDPYCSLIGALPPGCALHVVRPDGTGDSPTIQAAIDVAMDGDTIELADGIYTGDGNRDLDYRGKAITIRSQSGDPYSCVIDCQGTASDAHRAIRFRSRERATSVLQGITIMNGHIEYYSGGAVWCSDGSSPTIDHCVFRNNRTGASGGAVFCSDESDPTLSGCTFFENVAENGGGVHAYGSRPVLINCTFGRNTATAHGAGITCMAGSVVLQNTIIAFSTDGESAYCFSGDLSLACCDLYGNVGGDWVGAIADQEGLDGNICEDPLFCHPPSGNYRLTEDSPCAPFSPPNTECGLIGAWPVDCSIEAIDWNETVARTAILAEISPNPFHRSTRITYAVPGGPGSRSVRLSIFDPAGRLVRTLADAAQTAGEHTMTWDGYNETGKAAAAGVYLCRLHIGAEKLAKQIVLAR